MTFKRTTRTTLGILLCCGGLACDADREVREYRFPGSTSVIQLVGAFGPQKSMWGRRKVVGRVLVDGKRSVDFGEVHEGDYLAEAFDRQYPQHHWVAPDVLHFFHVPATAPCDVLFLANESTSKVAVLSIQVDDLIVMLNQAPGATRVLPVVPSTDPSAAYVRAVAVLAERGKHLQASRQIERDAQSRNGIRIVVTNDDIVISRVDVPKDVKSASGATCGQAAGSVDPSQTRRNQKGDELTRLAGDPEVPRT